jgi:hypothetical protein
MQIVNDLLLLGQLFQQPSILLLVILVLNGEHTDSLVPLADRQSQVLLHFPVVGLLFVVRVVVPARIRREYLSLIGFHEFVFELLDVQYFLAQGVPKELNFVFQFV